MSATVQYVTTEVLLSMANNLLKAHPDYQPGVRATAVEERGETLVFRGDYLLDKAGMPTARSRVVFNLFRYLAQTLSPRYHLKRTSKV